MSLLGLLGGGFGTAGFGESVDDVITEVITPQSSSITGCDSPGKNRAVVMPAATVSAFRWQFYNRSGDPVTALVESEKDDPTINQTTGPTRCALFFDPFRFCAGVQLGQIIYEDDGLTILPPAAVRNQPSLYMFELYWLQPAVEGERPLQLTGKGLVSVEESSLALMLDPDVKGYRGPISLTDVRSYLRDHVEDNDTLGRYEYTDTEILEAMMYPIRYWNETPPATSRYSAANFPFRERWLKATASRLLSIGALWMLRNQVAIQGEGIGADDRNKWQAMLTLARDGTAEYEQFVQITKRAENIKRGFAIL